MLDIEEIAISYRLHLPGPLARLFRDCMVTGEQSVKMLNLQTNLPAEGFLNIQFRVCSVSDGGCRIALDNSTYCAAARNREASDLQPFPLCDIYSLRGPCNAIVC